jgi:hypothetical protein
LLSVGPLGRSPWGGALGASEQSVPSPQREAAASGQRPPSVREGPTTDHLPPGSRLRKPFHPSSRKERHFLNTRLSGRQQAPPAGSTTLLSASDPDFRGVRVALGTGYNRVEGSRRASRNGLVSSHPKIPNVTIRNLPSLTRRKGINRSRAKGEAPLTSEELPCSTADPSASCAASCPSPRNECVYSV